MRYKAMFSPIQIGSVTVPNRFAVPPMGNNFANTDGTLSEKSAAYYGARAKGGYGLITIESTVVYKEAKGGPRKPCLYSDETVDSFRMVADACHKYGAKVSIQLQHAGPEGNSKLTGYPLKAASAIAPSSGREVPTAISREEIYKLIECYGDAAARAQRAGIDMVEVHCAHGYLVSTFISARTNNRLDEFGGCFENRMRLIKLIIENIRKKTHGTLPILCRINASDDIEGGQTVQDAAAVASYLEEECGVDAIHVSRAVHVHDEFMWAPGAVHGGFSAPLVTEIKQAVTVPVITVGRYTDVQYAELLVRQNRADIIAFGRQSIADPDLPNKVKQEEYEKVTPCIGCLLGCVPKMFKGEPITCAVNPCVGRETEITKAAEPKHVVVVGGGPGGLYAAKMCAMRGHTVTLLEKNENLGGNFYIAAFPAEKGDLTGAIRSFIVACEELGVTIRTNTEATPELIKSMNPDAVILATGSNPLILPIPGLANCGYVTAQDLLEGKANAGKKALVVGGGMVGCEAAEFLCERDHDVAVIEMKDTIAGDVSNENRVFIFQDFARHGVQLVPGAKVGQFYQDGVSYTKADGTAGELRGFDTIVLAMGSRSYNPLEEEVSQFAKTFVIGEAVKAPGNAMLATGEGLDAALSI